MSTADFIASEVEKFFPGQHKLIEGYDLGKLDREEKAVQVRDAKHRAPKDQARRYSEQMQHSVFPPIIVTKDGWIVDGNTRVAACQLKKQTVFPAVELSVSYEKSPAEVVARIDALAATMNAVNGNPLTPAETKKAIRSFLALGFKTDYISKHIGVSSTAVSRVRAQVEAETKLERSGFTSPGELTDQQRAALGHRDVTALNNDPYKALAQLAQDAGLKPNEIKDIARAAKESGSDADAIAVIDKARRDNDSRIKAIQLTGKGHPSPSAKFRKTLGQITSKIDSVESLIESDPSGVETYLEEIDEAINVLQALRNRQVA